MQNEGPASRKEEVVRVYSHRYRPFIDHASQSPLKLKRLRRLFSFKAHHLGALTTYVRLIKYLLAPLLTHKDPQSSCARRVADKNSSRQLAEQAHLPTPRYRIGVRVYECRFPRRTLLGSSVNREAISKAERSPPTSDRLQLATTAPARTALPALRRALRRS